MDSNGNGIGAQTNTQWLCARDFSGEVRGAQWVMVETDATKGLHSTGTHVA